MYLFLHISGPWIWDDTGDVRSRFKNNEDLACIHSRQQSASRVNVLSNLY